MYLLGYELLTCRNQPIHLYAPSAQHRAQHRNRCCFINICWTNTLLHSLAFFWVHNCTSVLPTTGLCACCRFWSLQRSLCPPTSPTPAPTPHHSGNSYFSPFQKVLNATKCCQAQCDKIKWQRAYLPRAKKLMGRHTLIYNETVLWAKKEKHWELWDKIIEKPNLGLKIIEDVKFPLRQRWYVKYLWWFRA